MKNSITYFNYVKRHFPFYIISGAILGIAIAILILAHRYNIYFSDTLEVMQNISLKKERIRFQVRETDALREYFINNFSMDINEKNSESLLFVALDDMKTSLKDATIKVGRLEKKGAMKELPVDFNAPMSSYGMIVTYMNYIESFRMPEYKIRRVLITREDSGEVMLTIKGTFVMPSLETNTLSLIKDRAAYG